ncbi:MAG: RrF2 family transcriptional regulator [Clostridia bacterium]|nr:RrF2 family transcriptional regulator [Clostridia bacterium]MDE7328858.1 RrF2 family transcriptional regulator [Clostridia bacterium]
MLISTKGRYALRVLIDLAEHSGGEYIPLKDVAQRQQISLKYLEGIMTTLSKAGMIDGLHGKGGGYRLCKPPEQYYIGDILKLTDGSLAPVACLDENAAKCEKATACKTLPMWKKLDSLLNDFFYSLTIKDLI